MTAVAFSSDGSSLFSASSGKEVVEWNVETGAVARKLKQVLYLTFSANSSEIVTRGTYDSQF